MSTMIAAGCQTRGPVIQWWATCRSLWLFRVDDSEAFQGRNLTQNLVRRHQCIYPDTLLHLERHGELERVQGSQTLPVAVSNDQTLRRGIVKLANRDERDCAACHVIEKSNTQCGGSLVIQMTGARLQRQCGVQLNAGKAGDNDAPVRPAKQGRDSLGAEFWMVQLNECAGIEEAVHRFRNRSSRSATITSDQEVASFAVILRTSS